MYIHTYIYAFYLREAGGAQSLWSHIFFIWTKVWFFHIARQIRFSFMAIHSIVGKLMIISFIIAAVRYKELLVDSKPFVEEVVRGAEETRWAPFWSQHFSLDLGVGFFNIWVFNSFIFKNNYLNFLIEMSWPWNNLWWSFLKTYISINYLPL